MACIYIKSIVPGGAAALVSVCVCVVGGRNSSPRAS